MPPPGHPPGLHHVHMSLGLAIQVISERNKMSSGFSTKLDSTQENVFINLSCVFGVSVESPGPPHTVLQGDLFIKDVY